MRHPSVYLRCSMAILGLAIKVILGQSNTGGIEITTLWTSVPLLHSQLARVIRSGYNSDPGKPELEASHKHNHTVLKCTVRDPRLNADIYVSCPALGSRALTSTCYQGCRPTKPCAALGETREPCVPNEQSVFCQKSQFSNGTVMLTLFLHRRDPRLAGLWFCTHAGLESTKFEVALEHPPVQENREEKSENSKATAENEKSAASQYINKSKEDRNDHVDSRPLAQMRKPPVVLGILAVLALSLLANMIFCIRCLLLRSYMDAVQESSKQASCLAHCLCLSKEMRRASESLKSPKLPKSANWSPIYGQSGVHTASTPLIYPLTVAHQSPVLLGTRPSMNPASMHGLSSASLPGTLRHYGQTRGVLSLPSNDGLQTVNVSCNQRPNGSPLPPNQGYLQSIDERGIANRYLPSYIRVPSVNAPSPTLSQRLLPVTQGDSVCQMQNPGTGSIGDPDNAPQYVFQTLPPVFRGHVIYDDVAAGNPSLLGPYSRGPNGTIADRQPTLFHLSHPYPIYSPKSFQSANGTSNVELYTQSADVENGGRLQQVYDAQLQPGKQECIQVPSGQQESEPSGRPLGVSSEKSPLLHKTTGINSQKVELGS